PVVARFVMLHSKGPGVIAESVQEVITAVMARSEQRARLRDQLLVMSSQLGTDLGGARAVAGQVEEMRYAILRPQLDGLIVDAGRERGIDQRGQRRRLELDFISR